MDFKVLVRDFAARLGVTDLPFDGDDVAHLQADELVLSFKELPARHLIKMWCKVATPPPEKLEQLYRLLLQAMFLDETLQGATFSLFQGAIYLQRVESLAELDVEGLMGIVERFLDQVEAWQESIRSFRADEGGAPASEPIPGGLAWGAPGFMEV